MSGFAFKWNICKDPSNFFRELLHFSNGLSACAFCCMAACQGDQKWSKGFPGNEEFLNDSKIEAEGTLPSHGGRKAVRGKNGSTKAH